MLKEKFKVLVVDDSLLVGSKVRDMLNDEGDVIVLDQAESCEDARRMMALHNPDILLLDIQMPGESGIELLKEIKQSHPKKMVIMITNHASEQYRILCKEYGADYFIDKSLEFESVIDLLKNMIARNIGNRL